jgi:hypothetical protein
MFVWGEIWSEGGTKGKQEENDAQQDTFAKNRALNHNIRLCIIVL